MAVGADELVLLGDAADILRDDAGGLVLPLGLVGRGADREAVVFDRRARLALRSPTAPPPNRDFQKDMGTSRVARM